MVKYHLLLAILLLASCAASTPIQYGLDANSYGPLKNYRDADTKASITPPLCNPDGKYADVNELSRQITALIARPFRSMSAVDETITHEGLQDNFQIPGDPSGQPTVAILRRNADKIVFWYVADLVTLQEVASAASTYCSREKRLAIYQGSSRKCQENGIPVNGKKIQATLVISQFACGG